VELTDIGLERNGKFQRNYISSMHIDLLCGLVVSVPGYRFRGPGSIPGATRFSEK
jgi:hypothetical protein